MKQIIFTLVMIIFVSTTSMAQRAKLSKEDRQKYLDEMRQYKREFLVKELNLSRDQQNQFFPVYDQMEDEINQVAEETRELEEKAIKNSEASDTELETVARTVFEQKSREGEIEMNYFVKFKEVLTPRQILLLKGSERKFTQQLVRHGRAKSK